MNCAQQSSVTLTAVCEQFYLDCEARNLSPRTVDYYREKLPVFVNWLASEGITTAGQLQPEHIRKFIIRGQNDGLSPHTHGFARCIKTLCFFAVREGFLSEPPMARVKMPRLPDVPLPPFTPKEAQALLQACRNERDKALVLTLLDSGVRASECCELNGSNLNMKTGAFGAPGKRPEIARDLRLRKNAACHPALNAIPTIPSTRSIAQRARGARERDSKGFLIVGPLLPRLASDILLLPLLLEPAIGHNVCCEQPLTKRIL